MEVLIKHIDLLHRRVLEGQTIATSQKVYSLFELETEWINQGKVQRGVELGHCLSIAIEQNQLIVHYQSPAQVEEEGRRKYVALRRAHSAVESAINALEHHGLDRCLDHGLHGFERSVGYGVLAYNLHVIGRRLLAVGLRAQRAAA